MGLQGIDRPHRIKDSIHISGQLLCAGISLVYWREYSTQKLCGSHQLSSVPNRLQPLSAFFYTKITHNWYKTMQSQLGDWVPRTIHQLRCFPQTVNSSTRFTFTPAVVAALAGCGTSKHGLLTPCLRAPGGRALPSSAAAIFLPYAPMSSTYPANEIIRLLKTFHGPKRRKEPEVLQRVQENSLNRNFNNLEKSHLSYKLPKSVGNYSGYFLLLTFRST